MQPTSRAWLRQEECRNRYRVPPCAGFGDGLEGSRSEGTDRFTVLVLIATLAAFLLWLLGTAAEQAGLHRWLHPGNDKRRVYSRLFLARLLLVIAATATATIWWPVSTCPICATRRPSGSMSTPRRCAVSAPWNRIPSASSSRPTSSTSTAPATTMNGSATRLNIQLRQRPWLERHRSARSSTSTSSRSLPSCD